MSADMVGWLVRLPATVGGAQVRVRSIDSADGMAVVGPVDLDGYTVPPALKIHPSYLVLIAPPEPPNGSVVRVKDGDEWWVAARHDEAGEEPDRGWFVTRATAARVGPHAWNVVCGSPTAKITHLVAQTEGVRG